MLPSFWGICLPMLSTCPRLQVIGLTSLLLPCWRCLPWKDHLECVTDCEAWVALQHAVTRRRILAIAERNTMKQLKMLKTKRKIDRSRSFRSGDLGSGHQGFIQNVQLPKPQSCAGGLWMSLVAHCRSVWQERTLTQWRPTLWA